MVHDSSTHLPTFLQLEDKQVICGNRPPIHYDVLSINTGSTPSHIEVPGSKENALAVKPINKFLQGWNQLMDKVIQREGDFKVVVVGAGAGGVEVALATQFHLQQLLREHSLSSEKLKFGIITGNTPVLSTHNKSIQKRFRRVLAERAITIHKRA